LPQAAGATRRAFLKTGAALGLSALGCGIVERPILGSADGRPRACGAQLSDIEHIVVLMQENRSFDHLFGTFPGVRGFDDRRNREAFFQPGYQGPGSQNGHLIPFHLDGRKPIGQCVGDFNRPTIDWVPQHLSWNHGRNDRFYEVHAQPQLDGPFAVNVMGYYEEPDIPYFWALARAFTLCDMYFSSVLCLTEPNRMYSVSATLDPRGTHGGPSLDTLISARGFGGEYRWATMADQLHTRRISWKSYTQPGGQFFNAFTAFPRFFRNPTLNRLGIQPTYPHEFEADMDRDQLPAVTWIQIPFPETEHPGTAVAKGEYAIDQLLRRIWRRPHIWRKTAVIINHDENGGFFDHVAPPTPPPGTKGEFLTVEPLPPLAGGIRGPIGLGFRVPAIVVSPWSRGGFVCSETFDHTSVLRLIERRFGAEVPNLSHWRRAVTGDMTSAFNFAEPPDFSIPRLPPTSATSPLVTTGQCAPNAPAVPYPVPSRIVFPRQQPGRARRPSGICKPPPSMGLG